MTVKREPLAPAEGERRAQRGYVPQYKAAAERILARLVDGTLNSIGVADPGAGKLDDIQICRHAGPQLVLDAYQVKWESQSTLGEGTFRNLLAELVRSRATVVATSQVRLEGSAPIDRVVAHLYSNKVASTSPLKGEDDGGRPYGPSGRSLHDFLTAVWAQAHSRQLTSPDEIPAPWRPYFQRIAADCGLELGDLLTLAPYLRVDLGQTLAEDELDPHDPRLDDLVQLRVLLQEIVSNHRKTEVWIDRETLVDRLDWQDRWTPRLGQNFPLTGLYEPLNQSVTSLTEAVDSIDRGYVILTGSPGSGKSSLLTQLFRTDSRVAARYFALLPTDSAARRGEAETFLHDVYLAIAAHGGNWNPAPREDRLDALRQAFSSELAKLGAAATASGQKTIVVVDGLDHVRREPKPHHPLLSELPAPSEVPAGVVMVLGTRSLDDVPPRISAASDSHRRHVAIRPLSREAVHRLCARGDVPELGERIAVLSDGHPLLVQTYLKLVADQDPNERLEVLGRFTPTSGDVWDFYGEVWHDIASAGGAISLLATVSRLREPIRRSWLADTGLSIEQMELLRSLAYLFDTRDDDRWRFFHSSFREFLVTKTSALDDAGALDRQLHCELAERCARSADDSPERWNELFHWVKAGQDERALTRATPEFFREQADRLRPPDEIGEDVRLVAGAIGPGCDPLAVVRLGLAAHELNMREYASPEGEPFLRLLIELDRPDLVPGHMRAIDNRTVGHDRRETAMNLAVLLDQRGQSGAARRIFDEHEPMEWFSGAPWDIRESPSGPYGGLWAWARAGARLRGAEYLLDLIPRLRIPANIHQSYARNAIEVQCELLWCAADELASVGDTQSARRVQEALCDYPVKGERNAAFVEIRLAQLDPTPEAVAGLRESVSFEELPFWLALATTTLVASEQDASEASTLLGQLESPDIPRNLGPEDDQRDAWEQFYRYWRLRARLRGSIDPRAAIADSPKDHDRELVIGARHLVSVAQIDGVAQATGAINTPEMLRALRQMHSWWDAPATASEWRLLRPNLAVRGANEHAIASVAQHAPNDMRQLVEYFVTRWDRVPKARRFDGASLIAWLANHGGGTLPLRKELGKLQSQVQSGGASADEMIELGPAWIAVADAQRALENLLAAVRIALAPSSDKDTQLATWIKLIAPILRTNLGSSVCDSLGEALAELGRTGRGGAPEYAAGSLVDELAAVNPDEALRVGKKLVGSRLIGTDRLLRGLIRGGAGQPSITWWVVVCEILVAIGGPPPEWALESAAAANSELAERWLKECAVRVSVEGRPTERRAWRTVLVEAGRVAGISPTHICVDPDALEPTDEAPENHPDSNYSPDPDPPITDLFQEISNGQSPYDRNRALERISRRLAELDAGQVDLLLQSAIGTESEGVVRARVAFRAAETGIDEEVWSQGIRAVEVSTAQGWSRHWDGGPMLDLVPLLYRLDRDTAHKAVMTRFSELAETNVHFLGTVGQSLPDFVDTLEIPANALAHEVIHAVAALLRDVSPITLPGPHDVSDHLPTPRSEDYDRVLGAATTELLSFDQPLASLVGQRALLALVSKGIGADHLPSALTESDDAAVRACAVITAAAEELSPAHGLIEVLTELAIAPRLDVRYATRMSLDALRAPIPPEPSGQPLPAGLRLELPDVPSGAHVNPVAARVDWWKGFISQLAAEAEIDPHALQEYVRARVDRKLEGVADIDRLDDAEVELGWDYPKPSMKATYDTLSEVAAALTDADRVGSLVALEAINRYPPLDPTLLRRRPESRPSVVATFVRRDWRHDLYRHQLVEIADAAAGRLARAHGEWIVLGERSEISLLDRDHHHELRESGLTRQDRPDDEPSFRLRSLLVSDYRRLPRHGTAERGSVWSDNRPNGGSPLGWLAINPQLATSLALRPSTDRPFDWAMNGEPAILSLWWKSGYLGWPVRSDADEVGEGWLVLGSVQIAEELVHAGWELGYSVTTSKGPYSNQETITGHGRTSLI